MEGLVPGSAATGVISRLPPGSQPREGLPDVMLGVMITMCEPSWAQVLSVEASAGHWAAGGRMEDHMGACVWWEQKVVAPVFGVSTNQTTGVLTWIQLFLTGRSFLLLGTLESLLSSGYLAPNKHLSEPLPPSHRAGVLKGTGVFAS